MKYITCLFLVVLFFGCNSPSEPATTNTGKMVVVTYYSGAVEQFPARTDIPFSKQSGIKTIQYENMLLTFPGTSAP